MRARPSISARTSASRSRSSPYDPTPTHTSDPSASVGLGGSSVNVPPSDPLPTDAGVKERNTRTFAPGQSGSDERSSDGSAPPVSGTPAKRTATSDEVEPRIERVENVSSAPVRRT